MTFDTIVERFRRIDKLIRINATGCPKDLGKLLGITERQVYATINKMKDLGAPIEYCNRRRSYIYSERCRFEFLFRREA